MLGIFVIAKLFCMLIMMVVIQIDPHDKITYNGIHTGTHTHTHTHTHTQMSTCEISEI